MAVGHGLKGWDDNKINLLNLGLVVLDLGYNDEHNSLSEIALRLVEDMLKYGPKDFSVRRCNSIRQKLKEPPPHRVLNFEMSGDLRRWSKAFRATKGKSFSMCSPLSMEGSMNFESKVLRECVAKQLRITEKMPGVGVVNQNEAVVWAGIRYYQNKMWPSVIEEDLLVGL
ncbi:hypothetical protein CEP53_006956 [Fusarium sp. AF-6]|nr:hypothetical protein CEP53_006956 [Fusarium sp. AF-6]